ncbi:MAG: nucleotidyltransferase family protein [Candidatus Kryptoniota bacterium]
MHNKYLEITRKIILNLIDKETVTVFLFGSRVGKNVKHDSDIDIGFISKNKLEQKLFSKIAEALEESIVPYHVDLIDFGKLEKEFKEIALGEIEIWNKAKDLDIN